MLAEVEPEAAHVCNLNDPHPLAAMALSCLTLLLSFSNDKKVDKLEQTRSS